MKRIADDVETKLGDSMDVQIGETCVPLEGRFLKVRTEETNLGNLVADILRDASGADACVLNGGTLRSDVIHPPGALTFRDLVAILPMLDETCVLEMTGAGIVGVGKRVLGVPRARGTVRAGERSGLRLRRRASSRVARGVRGDTQRHAARAGKKIQRVHESVPRAREGRVRFVRGAGGARAARGGGVPARADGVSQPSRDPRRAQRAGRARGGGRGRGERRRTRWFDARRAHSRAGSETVLSRVLASAAATRRDGARGARAIAPRREASNHRSAVPRAARRRTHRHPQPGGKHRGGVHVRLAKRPARGDETPRCIS